MIIDHITIVVSDLVKGIKQWENLFGYKQMTEPVINTRRNVKVLFIKKKAQL